MELRFDGRVVVVTGAGRGMGRAHALALAERGANVVVNDLGGDTAGGGASAVPANDVVAEIVANGGAAHANTESVGTAEGCEALIADTVERFGRVDAVIHNAGVITFLPVTQMVDSVVDPVVRVHLHGAIHLTRAAWPHFVVQGGGRMLYISSAAGLFGTPNLSHYGPAKAGVASLARMINLEGRGLGITANALAVFAVTRILEVALANEPERLEWLRRYMRPELTSAAALWLVHPDCPAKGRTYHALGGRVARVFLAETKGYTDLQLTPEDVRDHFDQIDGGSDWYEPDTDAHMHEVTASMLVDAGAEPPG